VALLCQGQQHGRLQKPSKYRRFWEADIISSFRQLEVRNFYRLTAIDKSLLHTVKLFALGRCACGARETSETTAAKGREVPISGTLFRFSFCLSSWPAYHSSNMWQWKWIYRQLPKGSEPKKCTKKASNLIAREIMDHFPEYQRKMGKTDRKELEYRFVKFVERYRLNALKVSWAWVSLGKLVRELASLSPTC